MFSTAVRNRRGVLLLILTAGVYALVLWMLVKGNGVLDIDNAVLYLEKRPSLGLFSASNDNWTNRTAVESEKHLLLRNHFNLSIEPTIVIGSDNDTYKDKYFIYRCDENTLSVCGGWINRIKGATVAYLIANLTGRTFKMEDKMKSCDFHNYIVQNHVDWHLPVSFHETVTQDANVSILWKIDDRNFLSDVDHDFSSDIDMNKRYVYFKANIEYFIKFKSLQRYQRQLSWMHNLTYTQIVNVLYRRLFKPSEYIQNKTKAFLTSNLLPHEKLVCAHLRTGPNPSNPQDVQAYRVTKEGFVNTWNFLEEITKLNDSKIFLMSDSEEVIQRAKHINMTFGKKVFSSPGRIAHIDRSEGVAADIKCEGLEKIIFEHYVLFHCDVLLISRSSIGVHAASVRDTDEGLYCLWDSGVLGPCTRNELIDIFDYQPLI